MFFISERGREKKDEAYNDREQGKKGKKTCNVGGRGGKKKRPKIARKEGTGKKRPIIGGGGWGGGKKEKRNTMAISY